VREDFAAVATGARGFVASAPAVHAA